MASAAGKVDTMSLTRLRYVDTMTPSLVFNNTQDKVQHNKADKTRENTSIIWESNDH